MKQRILLFILYKLPYPLISQTMPFLQKRIPVDSVYEEILLSRFGSYLKKHYSTVVRKVAKKNRFMRIEKGRFPYDYAFFNICFLNDVISLMIYALYRGYLPIVSMPSREERENLWEWYFKQPFEQKPGATTIVCDRTSIKYRPNLRLGFTSGHEHPDFKIWSFFYKKFVVFNKSTSTYIQNEIEKTGVQENSLGVLIRGTDYTGTKPKGHPIQPSVQELIHQAEAYHKLNHYTTIYVATEEKRLFDAICNAFGRDIVRQNQREYYDAQYYQRSLNYIGHVKFNRERDNYLKGLEYLSSLVILSHCTDLVAGNCGGTEFAVLFTQGYRNQYIFDKGLYQ